MPINQTLRVMKLTVFLLTVFSVHIMASTEAQTISFSGKNVPLKQVFAAIKKQTGYYVVYNSNDVLTGQTITINATNEPLGKFLEDVLNQQGLAYTITKKPYSSSL